MKYLRRLLDLIAASIPILLLSTSLHAQTTNHADVVAFQKALLLAQGTDVSGPCGAFAITKRVAWALRDEGAGLLSKPTGNNCEGFATDIVAYRSGQIVDVLGDGGGQNAPQWGCCDTVDPLRYRVAIDPGDVFVPPTPDPPPPTVDLEPLIQELNALRDELSVLKSRIANEEAARAAEDAALASRVFAVEQRIIPSRCVAAVFGIRVSCRLE